MPDSLRYIGHATVLIEVAGARLLTDPVLRARVGRVRRSWPGASLARWHRCDEVRVLRPGEATALDLAPR